MSNKFLNINGGDLIPLDTIKRIAEIGQSDRESLAKLGPHVDANRFNTRIEMSNNQKTYAPETLQEIKQQGVGLVQVNEGAFVPSDNIIKARNLNDKDRMRFFQHTGREMSSEFSSQIETKAGVVLAKTTAQDVLNMRANNVSSPSNAKSFNMAQARDAAMSNAAEPSKPTRSPTITPEMN